MSSTRTRHASDRQPGNSFQQDRLAPTGSGVSIVMLGVGVLAAIACGTWMWLPPSASSAEQPAKTSRLAGERALDQPGSARDQAQPPEQTSGPTGGADKQTELGRQTELDGQTELGRPTANPIDGARAYGYLRQLCALGPRISGSPGMAQQQELVTEHFEQLGAQVTRQEFLVRNPLGGERVAMANLIIQWHPARERRILLCAHYDTRPLPDRDPNPRRRKQGTFLGANDGASGTALLMELGHQMPDFDREIGVDFVLFDGEEFVYSDRRRDPYFLGSQWFAQQYVAQPPPYRYRWGVLLDMVGDADLQIYHERNSVMWRDTRPLVEAIWATAQRLGVDEFINRPKHNVRDDHLPLRNTAKIPTCDVIDFDYPYWHTESDTPRRCSPSSLAKVGWVVYEWLLHVD